MNAPPTTQSAPLDRGRAGQDASHRQCAITAAQRQELIAAASQALPIGELDVQAFGGRSAWNTRTRPGRAAAREKAIRFLVRAAELAMQSRPMLSGDDVAAALRSMELNPADVLVCHLTGAWLSSPAAVKHRGAEVSGALVELAHIIKRVKEDAP
jgi:hypothetical protein